MVRQLKVLLELSIETVLGVRESMLVCGGQTAPILESGLWWSNRAFYLLLPNCFQFFFNGTSISGNMYYDPVVKWGSNI